MSDVKVVAYPNPFSTRQCDLIIREGKTVAAIIEELQPVPELRKAAHVYIDDRYIARDTWSITVPKCGDLITVRMIPMGGGGKKNPLAMILSIAVIAATAWIGGGGLATAGGLFQSGSVSAALLAAGAGAVGMMAVNALIPPPVQDLGLRSGTEAKESPTLSIAGSKNTIRHYHPITRILGKHRIYPSYAAPPYTELVGHDQYLRMLFDIGWGPLELTEFKIGETDLTTYDGVELEVRQGFSWEDDITLFPGIVTEEAVGTKLTAALGYVEKTTLPDTSEISMDFSFPQGLVRFDLTTGDKLNTSVRLQAQAKLSSGSTWFDIDPTVTKAAETIHSQPPISVVWDPMIRNYKRDIVYIEKVTGRLGIVSALNKIRLDQLEYYEAGFITPTMPSVAYKIAEVDWVGGFHDDTNKPITVSLTLTDCRDAALTESGAGNFAPTLGAWTVGSYAPGQTQLAIYIDAGSYNADELIITANQSTPLRFGTVKVVPKGQYDVRVKRVTADSTSDRLFDEVYWMVLRSIEYEDPLPDKTRAKVAIRIKASEQLSGVVDQFNCVAHSILKTYNPNSGIWHNAVTSNPAACYIEVLQGIAAKQAIPDTRIDWTSLERFSEECDDNEFEFNGVLDYRSTVFDILRNVCSVGRGRFCMRDGQFSIAIDSTSVWDRGIRQHISPRNSWGVEGEKLMINQPHAFRVHHIDKDNGYRQCSFLCFADGYDEDTATEIQDLQLPNITSYQQAWKQARYFMAVARLRPETHSRMMDAEHLVASVGDLIRVSDDVAMHGICSGRITATIQANRYLRDAAGDIILDAAGNPISDAGGDYSITHIALDEECTMEAGKTYAIRARLNNGTTFYASIVTNAGSHRQLELSVPAPTGTTFPIVGDLVMFGETARETSEKIITRIDMRRSDLSARIHYVDAAIDVHYAHTGPIPDYDPDITKPFDITKWAPEAPTIVGLTSDESVIVKRADGTLISRIVVAFVASSGGNRVEFFESSYMKLDSRYARPKLTPWRTNPRVGNTATEFSIMDVEDGEKYYVRIRAVSPWGVPSEWVESDLHTVVGKSTLPPDPNKFVVNVMADGTRHFAFSVPYEPVDFYGFKIRYKIGAETKFTGANIWANMTALHEGVLTSSPWETNLLAAGSYTFGCKSVDVAGNLSENALYIGRDLTNPRIDSSIAMWSEFDEGWTGTLTDCEVGDEGYLHPSGTLSWDTIPATWDDWDRWNITPVESITYMREYDIGYTATFTPLVTVDAICQLEDDSLSTDDVDTTIEECHGTNGVDWSAYTAVSGEVTARYIRIRITVRSTNRFVEALDAAHDHTSETMEAIIT